MSLILSKNIKFSTFNTLQNSKNLHMKSLNITVISETHKILKLFIILWFNRDEASYLINSKLKSSKNDSHQSISTPLGSFNDEDMVMREKWKKISPTHHTSRTLTSRVEWNNEKSSTYNIFCIFFLLLAFHLVSFYFICKNTKHAKKKLMETKESFHAFLRFE